MTHVPAIGIAGLGYYVPESHHDAAHIAAQTGIPLEVVRDKFGIHKKARATGDEHVTDMAVKAAKAALGDFDPAELDMVVYHGSEYKEHHVWSAACHIQHRIGAHRAFAYEIMALCASATVSLKVARDMMIADPDLKNVLLVAATREGDLIDYTNPRSRFLYNIADGAGAVLLRRGQTTNQVLASALLSDGQFAKDVVIPPAGCFLDVPNPESMKSRLDPVSYANFVGVIRRAVEKSGYRMSDVRFLAATHMKRSIQHMLLKDLGLTEEQSFYLEEYGHVQSADQYIALKEGERLGRLKPGDLAVLVAAGTGYTWGATVVRWG